MNFCKYKDALGKPGKGAHFHILGIAIVDVILTIFLALGISYIGGWNFWIVLIVCFVVAILVHRLFCVNTAVNVILFGKV